MACCCCCGGGCIILKRGRARGVSEKFGLTTRPHDAGEKGAERFLPIGNALLRGIALLGVSLRRHLLVALRRHLLVALLGVALLGVALGGHPVSLGRHVIRHCLISPFCTLRLSLS